MAHADTAERVSAYLQGGMIKLHQLQPPTIADSHEPKKLVAQTIALTPAKAAQLAALLLQLAAAEAIANSGWGESGSGTGVID